MTDQSAGEGQGPSQPTDPATSGGSEAAFPPPEAESEGQQPKSPDEESDEAREGGTPTHAKGEQSGNDESDQD